ncbi:hypothetical protein JHK85_018190 [Glycine max]|nr:hypothetical protein JHK85_018190 [Glycine max]
MSLYDAAFVDTELSKRTSIFGLRLWVVIGILVGSLIVITLFLLSLCLTSRRRHHHHHHHKNPRPRHPSTTLPTPPISKEILEIVHVPPPPDSVHLPPPPPTKPDHPRSAATAALYSSGESRATASACETASSLGSVGPEVSHLGWGRWYTLRELEAATNGLCEENVIGEGGYGIVYRGLFPDGTKVAVKNLLNNKGQAEREFKVEVEAIGRVRHKNLVRLLGYCVEGAYRMLVYEYVDNGNLEQWLHGDVGPVSPMTWDIRMNIILGTAKGYYIHDLACIHCYVAPEYACTGMLTEKSDVYSFGILIMELITGRSPVDYSKPQGEVNLIEWLKSMVGNRKSEEVVDPKIAEKPSSKALKRALLVALRCVDPDAAKRPKIGHVIHMLEAEDLLFRDDRRTGGESSRSHRDYQLEHKDSKLDKRQIGGEITDQSEDDSTTSSRLHPQPHRSR